VLGSWRRSVGLLWVLVGAACGSVLAVVTVLVGVSQPAVLALPVIGGAAGAMLHRVRVGARARAHQRRIDEELPVILEFLALCLAAGESLMDALRRVSARGTGAVAAELRRVVVDVGTGESLTDALLAVTHRMDSPALARAVDQIVSAMDRGTPLTDVLHAHALESRAGAQRALIERAGRKEIAMLVPLVFLILPVSVLFAIFPGIVMLRLG
jgi:tight adherence protein C